MVPNTLLFYTYVFMCLETEFKSNIKVTAQAISEKDVYFINILKMMEIYGSEQSNNKWKSRVPEYHLVEKFGTASTKSYLKVNFLRYQPKIWHKTCSDDCR